MKLLYLPFILQGLLMIIDERLHLKRNLGAWERMGHPLDSLSVLAVLSTAATMPYNQNNLILFVSLAVFSCLFITKDEFIHAQECSAVEHWLHAVLFILHPILFLCTAFLWMTGENQSFLMIQASAVMVFMTYQFFRWSLPWMLKAK